MANAHREVDWNSIYGTDAVELDQPADDPVRDAPVAHDPQMEQLVEEFEAGNDEEQDALEVNLLQDDPIAASRDGTGRIVDDVAEEQLAEITEVGPMLDDEGGVEVAPGRDDTSPVLRRHRPNADLTRTGAVVEGNLDGPLDQSDEDRKVDEGTAA